MIQITLQVTETPENAYVNFKLNQARLVSRCCCTVDAYLLTL